MSTDKDQRFIDAVERGMPTAMAAQAVYGTAVPPHPAAPDATAGDGLLRHDIACQITAGTMPNRWRALDIADAVLALPALRDVLAAAARDAELREAVTSLAVRFETFGEVLHSVPTAEAYADAAASLRDVLDAT